MEKCLLIKTKDNRNFLTHEKNLTSLIEFSKVFLAEIYLVEYEKGKIFELKTLAQSMCKQEDDQEIQCKKIKRLFPKNNKSRQSILGTAQKIKDFIRRQLMSEKPLSLKDLKDKYNETGVTDACLCNHFASVRKDLLKEGVSFRKLGAGKYCIAERVDK